MFHDIVETRLILSDANFLDHNIVVAVDYKVQKSLLYHSCSFLTNQRFGFHCDMSHITVVTARPTLVYSWHNLVNTLVFVDMKFNPQQASDTLHINKNEGIN